MGLELLISQFGVEIGLAIFIVVLIAHIIRTNNETHNKGVREQNETRNQVEKSDADARHKTEVAQADTFIAIVAALNKLVDNLGKADERGTQERMQTLLSIEKLTGRIEGMMSALLDNTSKTKGMTAAVGDFGTQLDEFSGRLQYLPQIKTDLQDLVTRAGTIQEGFNTALDDRLAKLIALMMTFGGQLTALSSNTLTILEFIKLVNIALQLKGEPNEEPVPEID